jgi:TonB family protein
VRRIDDLRQRLAQAGISPRYLQRLGAELNDHFVDVALEARTHRKSTAETLEEAWIRLGSPEDIVTAFLERPELCSWRMRYPVLGQWAALAERYTLTLASPIRALRPAFPAVARYGIATTASVAVAFGVLLVAAQTTGYADTKRFNTSGDGAGKLIPVGRLISRDTSARSASLRAISAAGSRPPETVIADVRPTRAHLVRPSVETLAAMEFRDYLPIVKVAPIYPSVALSRGIEGYVVLEFTISRSGAVKNVVVVESSNPAFEQAATEAANKFKYSPRIIDGKPVEVEGVRNRVTFDLSA